MTVPRDGVEDGAVNERLRTAGRADPKAASGAGRPPSPREIAEGATGPACRHCGGTEWTSGPRPFCVNCWGYLDHQS